MISFRPGGEFGEKCPHCGHYNRFSIRKDWNRGKKRICSNCGNETDKELPEPTHIQSTLRSEKNACASD